MNEADVDARAAGRGATASPDGRAENAGRTANDTGTDTGTAPTAGVPSVADAVVDLLRTVRRSKARLMASASNDVDSATQILLRTTASEGPMRASALAASVHSDLSTVSRQVAGLVARGLLERRADPEDGRASLLVVTDTGQAMIADHAQSRLAFFEQVVSGWTPQERGQFVRLLERFTAAYDTTHTQWMTDAARDAACTGETKESSTV